MSTYEVPVPQEQDFYADLGLTQPATPEAIKQAWFKLAKQFHPDKKAPGKAIDAVEFRKIRAAYNCLRDPAQRRAYDARYSTIRAQWDGYRYSTNRREALQRAAAERARLAPHFRARIVAEHRRLLERLRARRGEAEQRLREAAQRLNEGRVARERLARQNAEQQQQRAAAAEQTEAWNHRMSTGRTAGGPGHEQRRSRWVQTPLGQQQHSFRIDGQWYGWSSTTVFWMGWDGELDEEARNFFSDARQ
ncbi:DnaJ domain-containing protein [Podospora australis]|uniref:DnaJ domain-containing protein n=1 Tax=Podospora australis TaxID=1536484 RepID=A0AAN7AFA1_9PEZI|nr:DnaJ domain-containing protein [Podospora australis]